MFLIRLIGNLITVAAWGLAGNWAGEQVRQLVTGEPVHSRQLFYSGPDGVLVIAIRPLLRNLLPAVLLGTVARPHWLWAFAGGLISSGLMGERSERAFYDLIRRQRSWG